jgi:uncharacterized protein (TIGR00255 family)
VIRSMTGFASIDREEGGHRVTATARAVNHRFLDLLIKVPPVLASIENRVRGLVQRRLTRGRVEVSIAIEVPEPAAREVVLDEVLLERVAGALNAARARGLVGGELSVSDLLRLPQVLEIRLRAVEPGAGVADTAAALVEQVVSDMLDALVVMRETEGGFLAADLDGRLRTLESLVDELERLARQGQQQLDDRLRERLAALPPELAGDTVAVAQEVVRFVARSDIEEELVRLRGHAEHWRALASGTEPCGRKLDFLVQEMNREVNTIGSKAEGPRVTEVVIAAKAELERIREQVQNVE